MPKNVNQWWLEKKEDVASAVHSFVSSVSEAQSPRALDNLTHRQLYENSESAGVTTSTYAITRSNVRLNLNIVQSVVDTVAAKIAKNRPKPSFQTDGAEYSERKKARQLQSFTDGLFDAVNIYKIAPRVFVDSLVFGTGVLKVFEVDGKIQVERVFPDEIIVEDQEGIYGEPRQMHQRKYVDRDVLAATFPKFKTSIASAKAVEPDMESIAAPQANQVLVIESWHLPSGPNATDGKHAITIENETLVLEDWSAKSFPFVFSRWTNRLLGFFGQGLAEQLRGIQSEITTLSRDIQLVMGRMSRPYWLVRTGSKVNPGHLKEIYGSVLNYSDDKPPTVVSPNAVPGEWFQQLDRLYSRGFEIAGVSQLSAQSMKPAGLDSGKAIREFNDIETERFILAGQAYENLFIEAAERMIELATAIAERDGSYPVTTRGKTFLEKIDWTDIDLGDSEYSIRIFPTSSLPNTPSGRLQTVQEMILSGLIDPETGKELLNFPDLESETDLALASRRVVQEIMEKMIEDGEYTSPEPYDDLQYAMKYAQMSYSRGKLHKAPEENLDLVRTYMAAVMDLMTMAQPTEPPTAPVPEAPVG